MQNIAVVDYAIDKLETIGSIFSYDFPQVTSRRLQRAQGKGIQAATLAPMTISAALFCSSVPRCPPSRS